MTRLLTSICLSVMLALPSMTLPAAAQTTTDGCMSIEAVMDNLANTPAEDRKGVSLIMADQPATDFLAEAVRMVRLTSRPWRHQGRDPPRHPQGRQRGSREACRGYRSLLPRPYALRD